MKAPPFFNPWSEVATGRNRLPHWEQLGGGTYLLTWRLADSIPQVVLDAYFEEHANWLKAHPEPWQDREERDYHAQFSARIDRLLDRNLGSCLLRKPRFAREVRDCLLQDHGDRAWIHSFVIMPNHVHALVTLASGERLSQALKTWKGVSSRRIRILSEFEIPSLWQKDYFDRLIRDAEHFANSVRYIRENPRKAGLGDGFLLHESETARRID